VKQLFTRLRPEVAPVFVSLAIASAYIGSALISGMHPRQLVSLFGWDGGWYTQIAQHGYTHLASSQQTYAFFPLMPALTAALDHLAPFFSIYVWGVAIHLVAIGLSAVLLDRILIAWPQWQRLLTIALVFTLPGAFFYVAFYSEGIFVLAELAVIWALLDERRVWWAPVGIIAATLSRPVGLVMIVPLVIVALARRRDYHWEKILGLIGASSLGAVAILVMFAVVAGDPLAFIHAKASWNDFNNYGFLGDFINYGWKVRRFISTAVRFQAGSTPISLGVWMDILVPLLVIASWWWNRALAVGAAALYLTSIVSGGVDSQARYMMVIIPAWVGAIFVLRGHRTTWMVIGLAVPVGLLLNLHLGATFARGVWAG